MSINDLLDTPPNGSPIPRLTPRAPLSVKELTAILVLGGLVFAAYDRLSQFASKTSVEQISTQQWQMRLDMNHRFDVLDARLNELSKPPPEKADGRKR